MKQKASYRVVTVAFLLVVLVGLSAATINQLQFSKLDKRHYLTDEQIAFIRPGLVLTVQDLSVSADRSVSVTYKITDPKGLPLDRDGVFTPGAVNTAFTLAYIPNDQDQYVPLTVRTQKSPITNVSAVQGTSENNGTTEKIADGVYKYTLRTKLPEGFDATATHSVGLVFYRTLSEFGLADDIANEVVNFRPDGGEVAKVREVVTTDSCLKCHDNETFGFHSHGARQTMEVCVLCHTDALIDPDTGGNVGMITMTHKIHRGKDLPSVVAGTPYQIIGNAQSVHDYSEVGLPQDIRNCEVCHDQTTDAVQKEAYLLRPTRAACGSCHDDVNFASGLNHANGLPQSSDNRCANCHWPEADMEFDASIKGAHTVPAQSAQLPGIVAEFIEITNTAPGQNPVVKFRVKNNAGQPYIPTELRALTLVIAGPTTDYKTLIRESAMADSVASGDALTYTFKAPIPADAQGSFVLAFEGSQNVVLNPGTTKEMTQRQTIQEHVLHTFAVTDATPVERRVVVADEKCDSCHGNLMFHGGNRQNPQYCITCHYPAATDAAMRTDATLPAETIDMKFMIHRIHMGEELTREFTLYGNGRTPHTYNEVLYPASRANCEKCHEPGTYNVPSPGIEKTAVSTREFYTPIPPNSSACLGCHDTLDAAAHTYLNTAPFGESCGTCHGENADFAVAKVHAQ